MSRTATLASLVAVAVAAGGGAAGARVIEVNTLTTNTVGPSFCELDDAITAANLDQGAGGCTHGSGADVITFAPGLAGTILVAADLPAIAGVLTIQGPGADVLAVSGQGARRVFSVAAGATAVISGLTIQDGVATGDVGGGILVQAGASLTLEDCSVASNSAMSGGGLAVEQAAVRIDRSLFEGDGAANGGSGAGILNDGGQLDLVDSTLSGNGSAGVAAGGGVATLGSGATRVYSSTLASNTAMQGGNVSDAAGATTSLTHTLLATPGAGNDCAGTIASTGHNLADDGSCALAGVGDLDSVAAGLAALADNGGPTATRALAPGSAAIDGGDVACFDPDDLPIVTDQRGPGFPRRTDGDGDRAVRCDIGAFETAPEPAAGLLAGTAAAALAVLARRRRPRVP
jgi:hypothetical protein